MSLLVPIPPDDENPDRARLRQVGAIVRDRLAEHPTAYKVPADKAELWAIGDFLTDEECDRLIALIDDVARPSTSFGTPYSAGYRTSFSGDPDPFDPFVIRIQRRIDDLLGVDSDCGETVQGQRYEPGQQFQNHTDWFPSGTPYWEQEKDRGGQRSITAMAFLNDVPAGGETSFPRLGIAFTPRKRVLLLWNNADIEGRPNPFTIHSGLPVKSGVKYIITRWYRTRKWY